MKKLTKKELIEKVQQLEQRIENDRQERIKNSFNKYQFLRDLETDIKNDIDAGNINDEEQIREYIDQAIENACIYYNDCFQIAMELNATDFETDLGTATTISQLACYVLNEYVYEKFDTDEFNNLIIERDEQLENEDK